METGHVPFDVAEDAPGIAEALGAGRLPARQARERLRLSLQAATDPIEGMVAFARALLAATPAARKELLARMAALGPQGAALAEAFRTVLGLLEDPDALVTLAAGAREAREARRRIRALAGVGPRSRRLGSLRCGVASIGDLTPGLARALVERTIRVAVGRGVRCAARSHGRAPARRGQRRRDASRSPPATRNVLLTLVAPDAPPAHLGRK